MEWLSRDLVHLVYIVCRGPTVHLPPTPSQPAYPPVVVTLTQLCRPRSSQGLGPRICGNPFMNC